LNRYLVTRILAMIPVVVLVTLFVFVMGRMIPGDPLLQLVPPEEARNLTPADMERMRRAYGLDAPIPVQYASWMIGLAQGDLGTSIRTRQPVAHLIAQRLPITGQLALMSMLISLSLGIPLGVIAALRPRTVTDSFASITALVGVSMPNIFLATLLVFVFAYTLRWMPSGGFIPFAASPLDSLKHTLLPAVTLGTALMGSVMRITRTSMIEVLNLDYVSTARAKGLSERRVIYGHALKNAFIPVLTVIGLQIGGILGGSFIVEQIFAIPGVGRLAVNSIFARDYPVVQGVVLFIALVYLVINLVVDLIYALLDPRIRYI
jgi:peptide/nickel transport system permease protein